MFFDKRSLGGKLWTPLKGKWELWIIKTGTLEKIFEPNYIPLAIKLWRLQAKGYRAGGGERKEYSRNIQESEGRIKMHIKWGIVKYDTFVYNAITMKPYNVKHLCYVKLWDTW